MGFSAKGRILYCTAKAMDSIGRLCSITFATLKRWSYDRMFNTPTTWVKIELADEYYERRDAVALMCTNPPFHQPALLQKYAFFSVGLNRMR